MATFTYKARSENGALVTGEVEGEDLSSVKRKLFDQGLLPTKVEKKPSELNILKLLKWRKGASVKDLVAITRQFAALFKAGVPIDRILLTLSKQTANEDLGKTLEKVRFDIASGMSMRDAFAKHPEYFDELYVNMIGIGEQGGVMDNVLNELGKVLQKEYRMKSNIKSATLYPKIVLFVFFAVTTLMITYVIPRFAIFYSGFNAELPLPTRILVGISNAVQAYWYIALAGIVGAVILYKRFIKTEVGVMWRDRLRFKLPVFGYLNLLVANARFGHLVGTLYNSGLPLSRTLEIAGNAIGNKVFKKDVDKINEDIGKGYSIAKSMDGMKYFTPLIVESVAVGEQSGTLGDMLNSIAGFYDEEVSDILDRLTTLIEPLLIFFIFGMVSLLALAIFLPMWNVTRVVLQGHG